MSGIFRQLEKGRERGGVGVSGDLRRKLEEAVKRDVRERRGGRKAEKAEEVETRLKVGKDTDTQELGGQR